VRVRPSGVIRGGAAPTATVDGVVLYFLAGSSLTPVLRPARRPLWPTQTLELLQQGPGPEERAAHLTSEVPAELGPVTVTTVPSGAVTVVVATDVTALSAAAVDQIACTLRDAMPTTTSVTLTGDTATRGPLTCPLAG
jgi:hypothetical protein